MSNTLDEMIEILQGFKEGKVVQVDDKMEGRWRSFTPPVNFKPNFKLYTYRIKPEPKVVWLNVFKNGFGNYCYKSRQAAIRGGSFIYDYVETIKMVEEMT